MRRSMVENENDKLIMLNETNQKKDEIDEMRHKAESKDAMMNIEKKDQ